MAGALVSSCDRAPVRKRVREFLDRTEWPVSDTADNRQEPPQ